MDGLDNPVSLPWHGLAVRLTRRPRQGGQHHPPTGSVLGRLDQEFLERDIDVDIVEFEVESSLHVGRADEARRGVVRPSHSPQFLAFGEGHPPLVVAASDGAFDRHFSGHFPQFYNDSSRRGAGKRAGCSALTFILIAQWENPYTQVVLAVDSHTGKGPLNAETAVRTTGLLTAGRNPGDRTDPVCRTVVIPAPHRIRAVKYSVTSTGAAGSQGTPKSSALAKRAGPWSGPPVIRLKNVRYMSVIRTFSIALWYPGVSRVFPVLSKVVNGCINDFQPACPQCGQGLRTTRRHSTPQVVVISCRQWPR